MNITPIALALARSILIYVSERISGYFERYHINLLSLGAGLLVGTIFLDILPYISTGESFLQHYVYVVFLAGFICVHILEKYSYQHTGSGDDLKRERTQFGFVGLVSYGILVGLLITVIFESHGNLAYIVIAPFFFREFAIGVSIKHISKMRFGLFEQIIKFLGPVAGALVGLLLISNNTHLFLVLSFATGIILYIVIRDIIPAGREGKPVYFVAGALITVAIFILVNN